MTSSNIKKVQIIAEIDDGTHIIAISDNQILIDVIVSLCQFQRIDETHVNKIPLTEIVVKEDENRHNEDLNILQRFSFYSYKDEPNILYLAGLYVNDEYRNKGIGTKVLKVANEVAKSIECNIIRLKTQKDTDAERFYRKNGYNILTDERNQVWLEKQSILQESVHKVAKRIGPKFKIGDTIYFNSFGEVKSMIVANVIANDNTGNPMYEDKNGNYVFEKDLIEYNPSDKENE